MPNSFIDTQSGKTIHAPLGETLIHATLRSCDLVPAFLNAIVDTPEYEQIILSLNGANHNLNVITDPTATENDERWASEDVTMLLQELFEVLDNYAPEGYHFSSHPGDGSDFGYWPNDPD